MKQLCIVVLFVLVALLVSASSVQAQAIRRGGGYNRDAAELAAYFATGGQYGDNGGLYVNGQGFYPLYNGYYVRRGADNRWWGVYDSYRRPLSTAVAIAVDRAMDLALLAMVQRRTRQMPAVNDYSYGQPVSPAYQVPVEAPRAEADVRRESAARLTQVRVSNKTGFLVRISVDGGDPILLRAGEETSVNEPLEGIVAEFREIRGSRVQWLAAEVREDDRLERFEVVLPR